MCILLMLGEVFNRYCRSTSLVVYSVVQSCISLLIFCLVVLFSIESKVLNSIIVELFLSSFSCVRFCFMYFRALLLNAYMFIIVVSP